MRRRDTLSIAAPAARPRVSGAGDRMQQPQDRPIWPSAGTAFALSIAFAVVLTYASTLVGPMGIHYVPRPPQDALRAFLHMPFVSHGSDQQADWMGNLLTLVPYGFLVTGVVWPRRSVWLRLPAFLLAMAVCLATVLMVKYLQLFFPPRTVTLNYVLAQTLGSLVGGGGFILWCDHVGPALLRRGDPVAALVILLRLYLLALILFLLMPLDFALNPADLLVQFQRLPDTLHVLPGEGRPLAVRLVVMAFSAAAFVPVGMLLSFVNQDGYRPRRSLPAIAGLGLLLTGGLFAVTALVISATPVLPAILYRAFGIVLGAVLLRQVVRQDPERLRSHAAAMVPWLVLPYLLALALANQLVSPAWRSFQHGIEETNTLGWLPLYDYYIVTKAAAAKSFVGHVWMYVPVGVAVWLRGPRTGRAPLAFALAALLSLFVETARYMRPGLEGDINAIAVAGLGAMLTLPLMDRAWSLLVELARRAPESGQPRGAPAQVSRPSPPSRRDPAAPAGPVEEY